MDIEFNTYESTKREFMLKIESLESACLIKNGGCDQLCSIDLDENVVCSCRDEFILQNDGITCRPNCTRVITNTTGTISSLNYPEYYNNNDNCRWSFDFPFGYSVEFYNFYINIEQSNNCEADYLTVGDSIFCGFQTISNILSFEAEFGDVIFVSNGQNVQKGFRFDYKVKSPIERQCELDNGGCSAICDIVHSQVVCSCFSNYELEEDGKTCRYITTTSTTTTTTSTTTTTTTTTVPYGCETVSINRLGGKKSSKEFSNVSDCYSLEPITGKLFATMAVFELEYPDPDCNRQV